TGGLVAGAGVTSDTHLTLDTKVIVHDDAQLTVYGSATGAGDFRLSAFNDIFYRENVAYKGGGVGSGIGAFSKLNADNVFATVQIGTDTGVDNGVRLSAAGKLELAANG